MLGTSIYVTHKPLRAVELCTMWSFSMSAKLSASIFVQSKNVSIASPRDDATAAAIFVVNVWIEKVMPFASTPVLY